MRKGLFIGMLLAAAALGILFAWIDSRPGWDDTAITVGLVLITSGLFGLSYPSRAWLWAVLVGVWIPLVEVNRSHNYGALLALAVALVGAFTGALVRKLFDSQRTSGLP